MVAGLLSSPEEQEGDENGDDDQPHIVPTLLCLDLLMIPPPIIHRISPCLVRDSLQGPNQVGHIAAITFHYIIILTLDLPRL